MFKSNVIQRVLDCAIEYADINRKLAEARGSGTVIDKIMPHHIRCYNSLISSLAKADDLLQDALVLAEYVKASPEFNNEVAK